MSKDMRFRNYLVLSFLISCSIKLSCETPLRNEEIRDNTLILLHVLFRHGDRTPDLSEIYPNDPYSNLTFSPFGFGALTNVGKQREYLIGKSLRKLYGRFLGSYTPVGVDARSTNYDRTKMSLALLLSGLYPPTDEQRWNKNLDWQPIPFNYENVENDRLLGDPRSNSPTYNNLYNDYLKSLDGLTIYASNRRLYEYLSNHTGLNIIQPNDVYNLYFALKSEESLGLELPEWTKSVWPGNITTAAVQEYLLSTATPRLKRLSGGFLLKKIVDDTKGKISETRVQKSRKIFLYSAHENNIAYLLTLLNLFYTHVPPFGAYVILEVHKVKETYGFKVYYEDYSDTRGPRLLKLRGCGTFCPIDEFIKLTEPYFPDSNDL